MWQNLIVALIVAAAAGFAARRIYKVLRDHNAPACSGCGGACGGITDHRTGDASPGNGSEA